MEPTATPSPLARADAVARRPSLGASLGLVALVALGAFALAVRDRPPTPAPREGTSASVVDQPGVVRDSGVLPVSDPAVPPAAAPLVVSARGRLFLVDGGAAVEVAGDLPLIQPLLSVDGGFVSVSGREAVFLAGPPMREPVVLGEAIDVFRSGDGSVWLSRNLGGPQQLERLPGAVPGGEIIDIGFGVLVHGVADSGLLLGRSEGTEVTDPATGEVVTVLPPLATVLTIAGDTVVATDGRCDSRRCALIVHDAADGDGLRWDLSGHRITNRPVGELSPDGSHLAIWLVDPVRDLAVSVIDLDSGEMQRGFVVGSGRMSADLSWTADGTAIYYVDPITSGVVRELRPFEDTPTDVVVVEGLGTIWSVAAAW